jgi:hypothetical protein
VALFPVLTMLLQRRIGDGFELTLQASLQGLTFLGRASGDGFGLHMSRFSVLLEIAPNAGQTDSQHTHHLAAWDPLIHCSQHAFSHIL